MVALARWLDAAKPDCRMIMQVHDELVLEVADDAIDRVRETVVSLMSGAAELSVPLKVDAGVGRNWDEAH